MTEHSEPIPAQRRALVLAQVRALGAVSIAALSARVGASASTVRRDLMQLERQGKLVRTHGGAALPDLEPSALEPPSAVAAEHAAAQKRAIGAAAAAMLSPGESVIFDSGSTVHAAAVAALARRIAFTAVTNDLDIARTLSASEALRVLMPGGTVRPRSLTLTGEPGAAFWASIRADVAFVGAHAVAEGWMTDTSIEIAAAKRAMIAAARRVVLLVDGSKFRPAAFCRIAPVFAAQAAVTDDGAPPEALAALREAGLAVTVVAAA